MKVEFLAQRPTYFQEEWPGKYDVFHWFEFVCGIPHTLFVISTYKENGKPNACLHSWSSFSGDGGGYFAVMPGILQRTHTFANIMRTKVFCINFLCSDYLEACQRTIQDNSDETDEFAVGNFTLEPAKAVEAPRIKESFLSLACSLEMQTDLSQKGIASLVIGRVQSIAIEDGFAASLDSRYSKSGFMFNINEPQNPLTAAGGVSAIGGIQIVKKYK